MQETAQAATKKTNGLILAFLLFAVIVTGVMVLTLLFAPFDSGTLYPGNTSANLNYGGWVAQEDTLLYYRNQAGGITLIDSEQNSEQVIYEGDCSYFNIVDEWLYFIDRGQIVRMPLTGFTTQKVQTATPVARMSVNGDWIYYTDQNGILYKMKNDSSQQRQLSPEGSVVGRFTVDNRLIVFEDQNGISRMATDGSAITPVVEGTVDMFLYTNDSLYYSQNGQILRIFSVQKADSGSSIPYDPPKATVFNYTLNSTESLLYYQAQDGIYRISLATPVLSATKPSKLCSETNAQAIYLTDDRIYYIDDAGELYSMALDGSDLKAVEES